MTATNIDSTSCLAVCDCPGAPYCGRLSLARKNSSIDKVYNSNYNSTKMHLLVSVKLNSPFDLLVSIVRPNLQLQLQYEQSMTVI